MKKLFFAWIALMAVAGFTSCDTKEDTTHFYFALGLQEYHVSGSESTAPVEDYLSTVFGHYCQALGMSSTNPVLIFSSGSFSERAEALKAKFDATVLPAAPDTNLSYTFTVALTGVGAAAHDGAGGSETIVTKIFSNQ